MAAGKFNWVGGDTHIYTNHLDGLKEQLERVPRQLPTLKINKTLNSLEDILSLSVEDFEVLGYDPYPAIKFELNVGV